MCRRLCGRRFAPETGGPHGLGLGQVEGEERAEFIVIAAGLEGEVERRGTNIRERAGCGQGTSAGNIGYGL